MFSYRPALLLLALLPFFASCKKDQTEPDPTPQPEYGSVNISIANTVNGQPLVLGSQDYVNDAGDTFRVNLYKYYISNIKLFKADGSHYAEPESYHLINQSQGGSLSFTIGNVPAGDYTSMTFMIGVDSTRNVSGAQTGALDPAHGMFWTWNTGYIMAKLEGTSTRSPDPSDLIVFHIGGFQGANKGIRTVSPSFNSAVARVTGSASPTIFLEAELAEWFRTPNAITFATTYNNMSVNATNKMLADNYADMFTVDHIQ